ncbi:MAG: hypothetical protein F8N37_12495 [Telmatospirillum sp.]|nr:hypothetical protein [Telmatospirillum sp.]
MPNVTFYIDKEKMPNSEILSFIMEECTEFCTDILKAALKNVHIIFVPVTHGRGHPVFVEIQYRLETFRTTPVMEHFMEAMENSITRRAGLTARIRCFGYAASSIFARN